MKIVVLSDHPNRTVEGKEARHLVRDVLRSIGENILLPEPMFKRIVRRRAIEALRASRPIYSTTDDVGQPAGTIIMMPAKIVGIIKEDGTFEKVGS